MTEHRVFVLGNRGQLGHAVEQRCVLCGMRCVGADLSGTPSVDVTSESDLRSFLKLEPGDWVVNCAAYTAVDAAEDDPERARAVNGIAPGIIARIAQERGASVVHISTDYVYDGRKNAPYTEDDPPKPLNVYGRTKWEGDEAVVRACERAVILRTAWLYGGVDHCGANQKPGGDFVRTMIRLAAEREEVHVVSDQTGSPTYTQDLAYAITQIVAHEAPRWGTYHCVNSGYVNRFAFAQTIIARAQVYGLLDRTARLIPIPSSAHRSRAERPHNSCLNTRKLQVVYGIALRSWREALDAYLILLRSAGISVRGTR